MGQKWKNIAKYFIYLCSTFYELWRFCLYFAPFKYVFPKNKTLILAFLKSNSKYICTFSYFCLAPLKTTYELPAVAAGKTENHGVAENRIFAGILSHSYCSEYIILCGSRERWLFSSQQTGFTVVCCCAHRSDKNTQKKFMNITCSHARTQISICCFLFGFHNISRGLGIP